MGGSRRWVRSPVCSNARTPVGCTHHARWCVTFGALPVPSPLQYDDKNEMFKTALHTNSFELLVIDDAEYSLGFGVQNIFVYVRCGQRFPSQLRLRRPVRGAPRRGRTRTRAHPHTYSHTHTPVA